MTAGFWDRQKIGFQLSAAVHSKLRNRWEWLWKWTSGGVAASPVPLWHEHTLFLSPGPSGMSKDGTRESLMTFHFCWCMQCVCRLCVTWNQTQNKSPSISWRSPCVTGSSGRCLGSASATTTLKCLLISVKLNKV